jgi:methylenetetrahydrofolate dehydrogenase (NADP+)/methenyltetrahydrofolate cyclohydrolase
MEKVLKGMPVSKAIYEDLKQQIVQFTSPPHLVIIQIGQDPASDYYTSNVQSKGKTIGVKVTVKEEPTTIPQGLLLKELDTLNHDETVHGIMVQKPLPAHIDAQIINQMIHPQKDVDGFHPCNLGNIILEKEGFIPCTPAATIEICRFYGISFATKHVVILGRSSIVGKPLANLLLQKKTDRNATVTICHSLTTNLQEITKQADILVAAIGKANYVTSDMIKKNVIILDIGVNQIADENNKLFYVGDVDYNSCYEKALAITPVPGGIGTVTTAMLLKNVILAYKNQKK